MRLISSLFFLIFLLSYYKRLGKAETALSGSVILPSASNFSVIPKNSCLKITLRKIRSYAQVVASLEMTDLKVESNKIHYVLNTDNIPPSSYILRVIFNVGWCSRYEDYYRESSLWLRWGDYHSTDQDNVIQLPLKKQIDLKLEYHKQFLCGEQLCYNPETCATNRTTNALECQCYINKNFDCDDSYEEWFCGSDGNSYMNECYSRKADCFSYTITRVHDGKCIQKVNVTMSGSVILPIGDDFSEVPRGSCLIVYLAEEDISNFCTANNRIITYRNITDLKFEDNKIDYAFDAEIPPSTYNLRALFNVGWCSKFDQEYFQYEWLRKYDYYLEMELNSDFIVRDSPKQNVTMNLVMENSETKRTFLEKIQYTEFFYDQSNRVVVVIGLALLWLCLAIFQLARRRRKSKAMRTAMRSYFKPTKAVVNKTPPGSYYYEIDRSEPVVVSEELHSVKLEPPPSSL